MVRYLAMLFALSASMLTLPPVEAETRFSYRSGSHAVAPFVTRSSRFHRHGHHPHQRFTRRHRVFEGYKGFGHPFVRGSGRRHGIHNRNHRSRLFVKRTRRHSVCKPVSKKFKLGGELIHYKATVCRLPDGTLKILK